MSIGTVNDRIREVLARAYGGNQSAFARAIGAKPQVVQAWVREDTPPGADYLERIVEAAEVNGHWLLTGKGPMEPPGEDYELERERATARRQLAEKLIQAVGKVVREVAEGAGVSTAPPEVGLARTMEILAETEQVVPPPAKQQIPKRRKRA